MLTFPPGDTWEQVPDPAPVLGHCDTWHAVKEAPAGKPDKSSVNVNGPRNDGDPFSEVTSGDTVTVYPSTPLMLVGTGDPIVLVTANVGVVESTLTAGNVAYAHCGFWFTPTVTPHGCDTAGGGAFAPPVVDVGAKFVNLFVNVPPPAGTDDSGTNSVIYEEPAVPSPYREKFNPALLAGAPEIGTEILTFPPGDDCVHVPAPADVPYCCTEHPCSVVPAGKLDKSSVNVSGLRSDGDAFGELIDVPTFTKYPGTPPTVVCNGLPIVLLKVKCGSVGSPPNVAYAHCGFWFRDAVAPHACVAVAGG